MDRVTCASTRALVSYTIDARSGTLDRVGSIEPAPVTWLLAARLG